MSGVDASGTPAMSASVTQAARSTTLGFVWPLPESGAAEIIWAYGSGNALAYHAQKGAANVDFLSGAAALSTSSCFAPRRRRPNLKTSPSSTPR